MRKGERGPFCWWCNGPLAKITNGPRKGKFASAVVKDRIGNEHRVHVCCAPAAKEDQRQITAQEKAHEEDATDSAIS